MFDVIVLDPPWSVNKIQRKSRPNQKKLEYPTMSLDEIKALDIKSVANENCMLFMWNIQKYMKDSWDILEAWGFKYQRILSWDKGNGMCLFGFHHRTEYVIFGYCGKIEMYPKRKTIPTSFSAKSERHSAKPDIFYSYLDRIPGKKLDIFARVQRPGWVCIGNEINGMEISEQLKLIDGNEETTIGKKLF